MRSFAPAPKSPAAASTRSTAQPPAHAEPRAPGQSGFGRQAGGQVGGHVGTQVSRGDQSVGSSGYSFGKLPLHPGGSLDPHTRRPTQSILSAAARGVAGSGDSLPHRDAIQRSFGKHSLDRVTAHRDTSAASAARAIGARAYTTGNRIAFAGSPDLHTTAHEAAHTVQQRSGSRPAGNLSRINDPLEQQANAIADRVVQGRSAEPLLDTLHSSGSQSASSNPTVVQRAPIETDFGKFDTTKYDKIGPLNGEYGLDIELNFDPDATKANAKQIGLVQSVQSKLGGKAAELFPVGKNRAVPSGEGAGSEIDRYGGGKYGNPVYPTDAPAAADKLETTATVPSWGQNGWNYKDGATDKHQIAILKDKPTLPGRGINSSQKFETNALGIEGVQAGKYMGSVTWGWSTDGHGNFIRDAVTRKSKGDPSAGFQAAAKQWNKTSVGGTLKTTADPTNVYDNSYAVAETVAKNTKVEVTNAAPIHDDITYDEATIKDGPKVGHTGRIKVSDMQDTGGTAVIKLPTP